jgi:RNA polymerase I-specific transcription initiation factor RRN7
VTEQILNLFPASKTIEQDQPHAEPELSTAGDRLRELHSQIELYPVSQKGEKIERPGDQYLCQSSKTELPIEHQTLLQAAADLLTITRNDLGRAVRHFENQFRDHMKDQKRREMKENMDVDRV